MARQKKAAKSAGKKKTRAKRTGGQGAAAKATAPDRLREAWQQTLRALSSAEAEVERQIRGLLKRNRIQASDASRALAHITGRLQKERRQAVKEFEARLKRVQQQVRKERKALDKMIEDAVQGALATFNIPSRREVTELTRKVNQLSRKLDDLPRRRARRA